ncbi:hypothetical protein PDESU_06154 [Pontiella desulfatans]|uniref:Ice-binding protein C-terminal domain-containing protein n=1 Tax=Pontiella desulfatans TaxID=2750659 RepID=A0A6C2UDC6_PONDE|nr:PEP-CTERM sorting domain-containing protein [Pontiella desulfatans]VGO17557.1 hypothetical protein PDESU_06154 [Pontiella desulfatans]
MKDKTVALLLMALAVSQTYSELLVGTPTNAPYADRVAVGEWGFGAGSPILQARPITTGAEAYNLTSIFFGDHLYVEPGVGAASGGISVSVYGNNGSVPGVPVAGGMNLFNATTLTVQEMMTATRTVTLAANSTYWFVASVDQSGGATRYWWNLTDSSAIDSGVTGYGMPLTSANNAAGWQDYPGTGLQMQVYGTAVPEPATLSFFGVGGIGAWLLRRRNQKRFRLKTGPEFEELDYSRSFMDEERTTTTLEHIERNRRKGVRTVLCS